MLHSIKRNPNPNPENQGLENSSGGTKSLFAHRLMTLIIDALSRNSDALYGIQMYMNIIEYNHETRSPE